MGSPQGIAVDVKRTAPACVAFIPMTGRYAQIPEAFGRLFGWIARHGLTAAGMPTGVYFTDPAQGEDAARWELRAPLAGDRADVAVDEAGCGVKHLGARVVACTVHRGPYEQIGPVYAALADWIGAHGYAASGPPEEVYLSGPGTPPGETLTEVRIPVAERAEGRA